MLHKLSIVYLVVAFVCFRFWIFVTEHKMVTKKYEYNKCIIYNRVWSVTDHVSSFIKFGALLYSDFNIVYAQFTNQLQSLPLHSVLHFAAKDQHTVLLGG